MVVVVFSANNGGIVIDILTRSVHLLVILTHWVDLDDECFDRKDANLKCTFLILFVLTLTLSAMLSVQTYLQMLALVPPPGTQLIHFVLESASRSAIT